MSNALFLHQIAVWVAGRIYRPGYSVLHGERSSRKRLKTAWIDRTLTRAVFFLAPQTRLLIVKDLRLFRRDPVQWLQFLLATWVLSFPLSIYRDWYREHQVWIW